jgi:hydrogenase/urease accessory protein HupE
MDRREVIAAGQAGFRNGLHGPLTMLMSLLIVGAMGFGATLPGKRFQWYTYGTMATLVVFGLLTSVQIPQLEANQPTPWMGITERINIYALMLWVAVLALGLLRAQGAAASQHIGKPTVTPQLIAR